jgi:hypothetical protein
MTVFAVLSLLLFVLVLMVYYANTSRESNGIYVCDYPYFIHAHQHGEDICGKIEVFRCFLMNE